MGVGRQGEEKWGRRWKDGNDLGVGSKGETLVTSDRGREGRGGKDRGSGRRGRKREEAILVVGVGNIGGGITER